MTDLSNTQEEQILNNIAAGGVYVSLHSGDEGDGTQRHPRSTAADYSHEFVAEADLTVSAPGERPSTLSNDLLVEFGTTTSDWGTVSHAALWADDVSGANEAPYTATVAKTGVAQGIV